VNNLCKYRSRRPEPAEANYLTRRKARFLFKLTDSAYNGSLSSLQLSRGCLKQLTALSVAVLPHKVDVVIAVNREDCNRTRGFHKHRVCLSARPAALLIPLDGKLYYLKISEEDSCFSIKLLHFSEILSFNDITGTDIKQRYYQVFLSYFLPATF
jgi:hypothetical protein